MLIKYVLAMQFSLWEIQITLRVVFPKAGVSLHVLANNLIYPSVYLFFLKIQTIAMMLEKGPLLWGTILTQLKARSSVQSPNFSLKTFCHNHPHHLHLQA